VTGGARGLGLVLAEALVEAGGHGKLSHFRVCHALQHICFSALSTSLPQAYTDTLRYIVYCLDRLNEPDASFYETQKRLLASDFEGSLHYKRVDVQDAKDLDWVISEAAAAHGRMDGLIAAAGVQNVTPALEYPPEKISEVSKSLFLASSCILLFTIWQR